MKKKDHKEQLEKIVKFFPAFDKRHQDPAKNYGIGSVRCLMVLRGNDKAVHFVFSTGMFLPETIQEYARDGRLNPSKSMGGKYFLLNEPMGYDVGYHDIKPHFEGQSVSQKKCNWLDGRSCYCDGSSLRAEEWMDVLRRNGDEAIWKMLEEYYYAMQ